jgi:hypothetical protein
MSKKLLENRPISNHYENVYGKTECHRRLDNLGIPIFIVQLEDNSDHGVQEAPHKPQYDVISDELFDRMFEEVAKKSNSPEKKKKSKRETKKKRKK